MSTSVTTAAPYARRTLGYSLCTAAGSTTIARYLVMLLLAGGMLGAHAERSDAQDLGRHLGRPDIGGGFLVYSMSDSTGAYALIHFGLYAGLNLPFVFLGDNLAFGLNPNLGGSMHVTGGNGSGAASLEVPVYLTLKYNTDASWKGSKSGVGFSLGIGAQHSSLFFLNSGTSVSYQRPAGMAEINFGSRRGSAGLYKLRFSSYIGGHREVFPDFPDDPVNFNQYALQLLWVPGY